MGKLAASLTLIICVVAGRSDAAPHAPVWTARWISMPGASQHGYGVYHFRRTFSLPSVPEHFNVRVTGDNQYQLFVNGARVISGPARGDLLHWRYESVDLARYLKAGRNAVAAVVWNWGELAPLAQITAQSGFLMQGESAAEEVVNTGKLWRATQDEAYRATAVTSADVGRVYYVSAPGEQFDGQRHPWGWAETDYDDSGWKPAHIDDVGCSREWNKDDVPGDCHDPRMLVQRPIPTLTEQPVHFSRVRASEGVQPSPAFLTGAAPLFVPAHTHAKILLDTDHVTTGYPELSVSGGRDAAVTLRYAESLWVRGTQEKGARDDVKGKEMRGVRDSFRSDGGQNRLLRPLWWRAFRYLEMTVDTAEEPLTIERIGASFVSYPFERRARFQSDGPEWLTRVLDVGWWTNRLSSQDTYLDAYYEQMQYVGDTRIEALVSLYESGDAKLMRNAIEQLDSSRTPDGLTFSRAPTRLYQYTPTYSLLWIGMLHDYWRYVDDPGFVRRMMPGVRAVLGWFERLQTADGTLERLPYYNFLDSDVKWNPKALAAYEMQLLDAFNQAAELEAAFVGEAFATADRASAARLRATLKKKYWDSARGLFADDTAHTSYSQQTNALAILTGLAVKTADRQRLMERTLNDKQLTQCTIYFRYYLHRALVAAGLGDRYLDMLTPWRELLSRGVTAWPESEAANARSDCHGWGDHPNIEIYRTVLGIDSAAPGFAKLRIEPHLGGLREASGSIPHPKGSVVIALKRDGAEHVQVELETPGAGEFRWNGRSHVFEAGKTRLRL